MWIFDSPDGTARLLRSRSGHSAAPHRVRFYGEGSTLLSAGHDRALRAFSIIREQQSSELSQGHLAKKAKAYHMKIDELRLPLVTDFVATSTKEREWANIVTVHEDDAAGYTWIYEQKTLGKNKMVNPAIKPAASAKCVALSACGNFSILGFADGRLEKYNMQSGFLRGGFGEKKNKKTGERDRHTTPVMGVAVDGLNRIVMSGAFDGIVKVISYSPSFI